MSHWSDGEVKALTELTKAEIEKVLIDNPAFFHNVKAQLNSWTLDYMEVEHTFARNAVGSETEHLFYRYSDIWEGYPKSEFEDEYAETALRWLEITNWNQYFFGKRPAGVLHLHLNDLREARIAWMRYEELEEKWYDDAEGITEANVHDAYRHAIDLIQAIWSQYVIDTESALDVSLEEAVTHVLDYRSDIYNVFEVTLNNGSYLLSIEGEPIVEYDISDYYGDPPDYEIDRW